MYGLWYFWHNLGEESERITAYHLEEEDGEYPDGCVHAEWSEGGQLGGGPDTECDEVRDGGDGDRHPRLLHRPAHALHHTQTLS